MTKLQKVIQYLYESDNKEQLQNPISYFIWLLARNKLITNEEYDYLEKLDIRQMNHTIDVVQRIQDED